MVSVYVFHRDFKKFRVIDDEKDQSIDFTCYSTYKRNRWYHSCNGDGIEDFNIQYSKCVNETYLYETILKQAIRKYNIRFKTSFNVKNVKRISL